MKDIGAKACRFAGC